jgi:putative alpha-1,2-mannosidase
MIIKFIPMAVLLFVTTWLQAQEKFTDYVNPFLGTTTLWDSVDIGYKPTHRTWGGETFPGSSLPNAMVQLTPVTKFHSGSG